MTADLKAEPGRVFVGKILGHVHLVTVKGVRRRKDGTPTSCTLVYDEDIHAEIKVSLGHNGELTGFRRVTLATVGHARSIADAVGKEIPTDSFVIVTKDRVGAGPVLGGGMG